MSAIRIQPFGGLVPKLSANLLTNGQAQTALNAKLFSGEIRSWRRPVAVATTLCASAITVYRLHTLLAEKWLSWPYDVDVVPSPVADTTDFRIYYTVNGSSPQKTNYALASTGVGPWPAASMELGVSAPVTAPVLTKVDGSGTSETRAYVYTNISTFGSVLEESAPSSAASISVLPVSGTVTLAGFDAAPTTGYNITSRRIYRTLTSSYLLVKDLAVHELTVTITNAAPGVVTWTAHGLVAGKPVFFRTTGTLPTGFSPNVAYYVIAAGLTANTFQLSATVGGAAINTSSAGSGVHTGVEGYIDALTPAQIPGDNLLTIGWQAPPATLRGLVSMPNGIMAGFVGNTVYFCEPYQPHAWPLAYSLTVDYQIVGLGVYGSTLVVATEGRPYTISGIHPSSMSQEKLSVLEPCMAKLSIAQDKYGVMYASPNGLVALGPGTLDVLSKDYYSRDDWQALTPSTMVASIYNGRYISGYGGTGKAIVLAREDTPPLTEILWQANKFYVDAQTTKLYGVSSLDNVLYQFDADPDNNLTYEWKSQRFVGYKPEAFNCFQLAADYNGAADTASLIAANAVLAAANVSLITSGLTNGYLNGAPLNTYAINGSILSTLASISARTVSVTFYNDGLQVYSTNVTSVEPLRLPSLRSYVWEIVISGTVAVRSLSMATSITELKAI